MRAAFSAVRFALRRMEHRAHARQRLVADVASVDVGVVGGEPAEVHADPILQFVQEELPARRVALQEGGCDVKEGVGQQDQRHSARRCLEGFVAFLHANPRRPRFERDTLAPRPAPANNADTIAAYIVGLSAPRSP